jgi:hypothetical protein
VITRIIVIFWVIGATVCAANVLYDAQTDVHGSVSVYFGTDEPQFKGWLEGD